MDNTSNNGKPIGSSGTDNNGPDAKEKLAADLDSNKATNVETQPVAQSETNVVPQEKTEVPQAEIKPVSSVKTEVTQQAQKAVTEGVAQAQQAGKESVEKIGNLVGGVLQPKKDDANQPPVNKDEKVYAAISYIPFVALVSIIVKPDSAFVRLHAKQGLLLALIFFFVGILAAIVSLFGIIGQFLAFLLGLVPMAVLFIDIYSMYLSFMGYWWKIPVLGAVADVIPVEWMAKTSKSNLSGQVGVAKEDYDVRQDVLKKEKDEAKAPQPTSEVQDPAVSTPQQANSLNGGEQKTGPETNSQPVEPPKQ